MNPFKHIKLLLVVFLGCCSIAIAADENMEGAADEQGQIIGIAVMPQRGLTMTQVEKLYGQPEKRVDAVGQPPISRWYYDGFVVYFENQYVIHSIANGN